MLACGADTVTLCHLVERKTCCVPGCGTQTKGQCVYVPKPLPQHVLPLGWTSREGRWGTLHPFLDTFWSLEQCSPLEW